MALWSALVVSFGLPTVKRCLTREAGADRRVTAGHHRLKGSGDGRQASACRARRATARQGAAFADAPSVDRPPGISR